MQSLPSPRGPLSELLLSRLLDEPGSLPSVEPAPAADPLSDEDLQLALYLCYELHYRGLPGIDDRWEWDPAALALRAALERRFERALVDRLGAPSDGVAAEEMDVALRAIAEADDETLHEAVRRSMGGSPRDAEARA
jgi:hypothetical protein